MNVFVLDFLYTPHLPASNNMHTVVCTFSEMFNKHYRVCYYTALDTQRLNQTVLGYQRTVFTGAVWKMFGKIGAYICH